MLKSTKSFLSSFAIVSAIALAATPALAQMEPDGPGMEDVDVVINLPDMGPPGGDMSLPPPGMDGPEMAFSMPFPPPDAFAMRRGGPPGGPGHGGPGRGGGCPLSMLDGENAVTDDQYEKLYDLKNRTMDQVGPKMLELCTASRHLKDVLTQETIDEKSAKKLQGQITALKADLEGIKLNSKMEMMQVLTGAQRKELRKAMIKGPGGRGSLGGGPRGMMMKRFGKGEH